MLFLFTLLYSLSLRFPPSLTPPGTLHLPSLPPFLPPFLRDLLQTSTAADFYSKMARLGERLRRAQLLPSAEFIQIIHTIQEVITAKNSNIPPIRKLREKYAYNVCPCADPEDEEVTECKRRHNRPCPKPSRGGAFSLKSGGTPSSAGGKSSRGRRNGFKEKSGKVQAEFVSGQRNTSLPEEELKESPIKAQIKLLQEHYDLVARQPATVRCELDLAPPQARYTCPQTRYKSSADSDGSLLISPLQESLYGPDVPESVVAKSKVCVCVWCVEVSLVVCTLSL